MKAQKLTSRLSLTRMALAAACAIFCTSQLSAVAETGSKAWLRYAPITEPTTRERFSTLPSVIVALDNSEVVASAQAELIRGLRGMFGRTSRAARGLPKESAIVLGTFAAVQTAIPSISSWPELREDGFWLKTIDIDGTSHWLITAPNDRGVLYGAMFLLRNIALAAPIDVLNEKQSPAVPLRVLTHADNPDGTVEGGHAGRSIFWEAGRTTRDLKRVADYARLLASLGVNGVSINNGNDSSHVLSAEFIHEAARIADSFRHWGVRLFISADLANPQTLGGLRTSDPLDTGVAAFWQRKIDEAYRAIPDLGGFIVTATSAGRSLPSIYVRSHAETANALAAPLAAHGGVLFYCTKIDATTATTNWRSPPGDPATLSNTEFAPLDGQFAENVILQTELGPLGVAVREPPSPLFGHLKQTNQAIAFQIAPPCVAESRALCYLSPTWKDVLDFDTRGKNGAATVKQNVAGGFLHKQGGAFIAVAGVGRDAAWLGNPLAMANIYAFGRLAWNPELASKDIATEWTQQTFGREPLVVTTVIDLLMRSRRTYENFAAPLGVSLPVGAAEFADSTTIGHDRTTTGSRFTSQYLRPVAKVYESLETCPDQFLLFFHRVPFAHVLQSSKPAAQHIYDSTYIGARDSAKAVEKWRRLAGHVDATRYRSVLNLLEGQAAHAQVCRDALCDWLSTTSGIADTQGRVGKHPYRVEAERMRMEGFKRIDIAPSYVASAGRAAACAEQVGTLQWKFKGKAGWFNINVCYYDEDDGVSRFRLSVGEQVVDQWAADAAYAGDEPAIQTAKRHCTTRVTLRPGDELSIEATADTLERAVIDYVEVESAE